jgi:integrase
MRLRVLPALGGAKLADVRRPDLQALADKLVAMQLSPPTVRNAFLPLRGLFNQALADEAIAVSPCDGIRLPAVRSRRDRIVSLQGAEELISAAPERDRALWATAFYGGLRVGELRALRAKSVDLAAGVIFVKCGWDEKAGEIAPKSRTGRRRVPIAGALRDHLLKHRMELDRSGDELIFGRAPSLPFDPSVVQRRADKAWEAAGLERVTPHECRHTFASLMLAACVNAKALSTFMGHATISITLDLYGHLMPGSEAEAAALLDDYVVAQRKAAEGRARDVDAGFAGASAGAYMAPPG